MHKSAVARISKDHRQGRLRVFAIWRGFEEVRDWVSFRFLRCKQCRLMCHGLLGVHRAKTVLSRIVDPLINSSLSLGFASADFGGGPDAGLKYRGNGVNEV